MRWSSLLDFWHDRHPAMRALVVLVVLGAIAALSYRPARAAWHRFDSARHLKSATEAAQGGNFSAAREHALSVLRRDPGSLPALRIFQRSTTALNDPRRGEISRILLVHPEAGPDDRLAAWQVVTATSPLGWVAMSWKRLPAGEQSQSDFVEAFLKRLIDERRIGDAEILLRDHMPESPTSLFEAEVLRLELARGTASGRSKFQTELRRLLKTRSPVAPHVIPLIDELPQGSLAGALLPALSAWQKQNPGPVDRLRVARYEIAAAPERAGEIVQAILDDPGAEFPEAAAAWLVALGMPAKVGPFLDARPDASSEAFWRVRLVSAWRMEDWSAAAALLAAPPPDAELLEVYGDRAIVSRRLGDRAREAPAWAEATREATLSNTDDAWIRLARKMEREGLDDLANQAWVEAIRHGRGPLPLYEDIAPLLVMLAANAKERELIDITRVYQEFEAGNSALTIQRTYLGCLNGFDSPEAGILRLTPLLETQPDIKPLRVVLALLHLLSDQPERALALLDDAEIDWTEAPAAYRAIHALVLLGCGRTDSGIEPPGLESPPLLPSEKRIFTAMARELGSKEK